MEKSKQEMGLRKLKVKIKTWESKFALSYQRKPSKDDIQRASPEIKDAYKSYWILKNKLETENMNKEDVWSDKLNKSCSVNCNSQTSDEVFKKFCNKIRERSTDMKQEMHVKEFLQKEKIIKEHNFEETDNFSNLKLVDTKQESDTIDLNSLNDDMQILKPIKKIFKFNDVCKKVKSVNVLSSSVDIKNLENNLFFERNVDNKWLERCYNDKLSDISSNETLANNSHTPKQSVSHNTEGFSTEVVKDADREKISFFQSIENDSLKFLEDNNEKCTEVNSSSIVPGENKQNDDQASKLFSCGVNVDESTIESPISFSEVKSFKSVASLNKDKESETEEIKTIKKRKLTKIHTANSKLTNHLERKMASGTLNENFVKVNIKKKKFSRGHKAVNVKKLKWKKWKELKNLGSNTGCSIPANSNCFKCGQPGHWARNCKVLTKDTEQHDTSTDFDDAPLPTLEEAAKLANQSNSDKLNFKNKKSHEISSDDICTDIPLKDDHEFTEVHPSGKIIKPLYELAASGRLVETPTEVFDSLKEMGYSDFREGQEMAVMRILSGLSTLVVLPTGSGKSLCYQLPAYMYAKHFSSITLVISPLVSLMEDQVTGLPSCLHAICLHSGMTDIQKKLSLQDLRDRKAQILLVSPEAVIGGLTQGTGMLPPDLPPISFACIDEAHCLSQWSHNFRPSYLQLYKVLTQKLNVKCILGLTATANHSTAQEIVFHLGFKSMEESVIGSTGIPKNLHLSVSRDKDKDRALIQLLTGDRFSNCSSIIIYCIRRDETERLAALIRTCLQDHIAEELPAKKSKTKSKKRNFKWTAEAYHAGLAAPRRRSIQKQFMTGKLRVIVATIAFGMGLDKRDVRAVIHFNMPKSFESYVQEIGRAGRDGLDSHCHLFLDNEGRDIQELQRFIYSNSTDRYVIRKLLKKVFVPCKCKTSELKQSTGNVETLNDTNLQASCHKHEIAFSINDTVQELDLKEENISTLLCYLELHPKKWIEVLSPTYATCTIRCYGGPKQLRGLALKAPPVAAAFALDSKKGRKLENISAYDFPVVEVSCIMGWDQALVKRSIKKLEWNDQNRKTGVIAEFSDLAFHLRAPGNLSADELDSVLDFLYDKVSKSEKGEILNLQSLHSIFSKFSQPHYWTCCDEAPSTCSEGIKEAINMYFDETKSPISVEDSNLKDGSDDINNVDINDVCSQIRDIIYTNNDQNFNGRAIARIFHGIGSPCYPSEVWGRVRKFWRCLLHVNFNLLVKLANEELKKAK